MRDQKSARVDLEGGMKEFDLSEIAPGDVVRVPYGPTIVLTLVSFSAGHRGIWGLEMHGEPYVAVVQSPAEQPPPTETHERG